MKKHKHINFDFDDDELTEAIKRIRSENKEVLPSEPCIEGKSHYWISEKIGYSYPVTQYKEKCVYCGKEKIICIANFR